jgi:hypothetical protein
MIDIILISKLNSRILGSYVKKKKYNEERRMKERKKERDHKYKKMPSAKILWLS